MFPEDVETITMTKKDYDRNVEQLLFKKIEAEQEIERLHSIIKEVKEYIKNLRDDDEYLEELHFSYDDKYKLLEILDKENNNE